MGIGKNKISAEIFNIEPTAILDLFRIYPDIVNKPNVYFNLHGGSVFGVGLTWQGEDYMPVSMEHEGFEVSADGRPNRPLVRFSNHQYFASALLANNDDFSNARIQRKRTFVKFLDDSNFDGGNPWGEADPDAEISNDTYLVSQKRRENKEFVELELTNPLDLENFEVNHRRILGKYCYWKYRGPGCQYEGVPKERADRQPFTDQNNDPLTSATNAKKNGVSYINQSGFDYGRAGDIYKRDKRYYRGNIVYKINDRVRIQSDSDPNSFLPLLVYYVSKASSIDGSANKGKDPDKHPEFWDRDGCSKSLASCKSRFTELEEVSEEIDSVNYSQNVFRSYEASLTNMGMLVPKSGLEQHFDFAIGENNKKGWAKEFTMLLHFSNTSGYENLHSYGEVPDYSNIFNSDVRNNYKGFKLAYLNNSSYSELIIRCRRRTGGSTYENVILYPCRTGGVSGGSNLVVNANVNLQSCRDLLIKVRMRNTDPSVASKNKSIDIEITGFNKGSASGELNSRGEAKSFKIKNSFDTNYVLRSNARRIVVMGGPTSRDTSSDVTPMNNWSHNNCSLGGLVIWNTNVPDSILNKTKATRVYNDQDDTKILRRFQDIDQREELRASILENCVAYWSDASENGMTEHIAGRDLVFQSTQTQKVAIAGSSFFNQTDWTKPQVVSSEPRLEVLTSVSARFNSVISNTEDVGILPYGGYPGTDTYQFRTEP